MAKFTSLILIATIAMASFSSAAPVASSTSTAAATTATVTATATATATATVDPTVIPTATADETSPEPTIAIANAFSSSVKYTGKATWFTHSYGSCNIKWNGNVEPTVALNSHQMGAASWGNPACDQQVLVTNKHNGKSVVARIVDKCPGSECAWGSLDLSTAAFKSIGNLDTGILNIEWHFV